MVSSDYLSDTPARLSSSLRGRWVLDLPAPDSPIYIRRYETISESSKILQDHPSDPLEATWRNLNETGDLNVSTIGKALSSPCAIVTSQPSRQLWVFSTEEDVADVWDHLQELSPRLTPLIASALVSCSEHGHNLACLSRNAKCQVFINSTEGSHRNWDLFTAALVEKLAWKNGNRVFMVPSTLTDHQIPINATLRPLSSTKLFLTVQPNSFRRQRYLAPDLCLCTLQILGLPAVLLGPANFTAAQEARLSSSFDQTLGSAWKDGRIEARTRSSLVDRPYSDWSIFWVPLLQIETPPSPKTAGKQTARQIVEKWQRCQGVVTVWPSHLSERSDDSASAPTRQVDIRTGILSHLNASDLMAIATDVFGFLANYREPDLIDLEGEEGELDKEEDEDQTMDGKSAFDLGTIHEDMDGSNVHQAGTRSSPESRSDIDDLFSAGSNSPGQPEMLDQVPLSFLEEEHTPAGIQLDVVEFLGKMESEDQSERKIAQRGSTEEGPESRNLDLTNLITEDDFAFFDSPTDEVDRNNGLDLDMGMEVDRPLITDDPPIAVQQEDSESTSAKNINHAVVEEHSATGLIHKQSALSTVSRTAQVHERHSEASILSSPDIPSPAAQTSPQTVSIKAPISLDLIPTSFAAVPLPFSTGPTTFLYSPPSPAPTLESLSMRLQPLPKMKSLDKPSYPLAWEEDYDVSDLEDEEGYTGPPTPESEYDPYTSSSGKSTPVGAKNTTSQAGDEEVVEFCSIRCVSATEWIRLLQGAKEGLEDLQREWNLSWVQTSPGSNGTGVGALPPSPAETPRPTKTVDKDGALAQMDCERFAREVVGNKALRDMLGVNADGDETIITTQRGVKELIDGGATLSDLDSDTMIRTLTQPHIHTGFANDIMRLSISSLNYWSELGLQPAGGKKDVEAVLIGEAGTGMFEIGRSFMRELGSNYEARGFGSHHTSRMGSAIDGVVTVPLEAYPEAVLNLVNTSSQGNVVIYVLVPSLGSISRTIMRDLFANHLLLPDRVIIHLLTPSSLSSVNYSQLNLNVYDRIPRPIHPISIRGHPLDDVTEQNLPHMAFTLAKREEDVKPEFLMTWPLRSYDVMNRWKMVHATYAVNEELGVMVGFMMDSGAEAWDMKVWRTAIDVTIQERVGILWDWAKRMAGEWVVEWRMSMCKVGLMSHDELQAWRNLLGKKAPPVTLLMTESLPSPSLTDKRIPRPRHVANITPAILTDPGTRLIDATLSGQMTTMSDIRLPVDVSVTSGSSGMSQARSTMYPPSIFFLTLSSSVSDGFFTVPFHILYHKSPLGGDDSEEDQGMGKAQNEIGEDYYRLSTIINKRWEIERGLQGCASIGLEGLEKWVKIWAQRGEGVAK
ncbi:hypothetical protein IAR55_004147 [Kwoniella newhampshirensis]|uniref:Mediator of RNA polymerase II transcription subunit 13 n=1 Tax=Kwoniella newhampshirensis TaxID=1651941 RepID=A0AAW0YLU4_9TREE